MARAVEVEGLAKFRRSLKETDKGALKAVQATTKRAAQVVATEAGRLAPRGTRAIPASRRPQVRLADSYKASTSGAKGLVKSPLVYARIYEYRKSGTAAQMRGTRPVRRAMDNKQNEVARELAAGFDKAARRAGWR